MKLPRKILIAFALAVILLITLLAGLKPKGYRFRNDATWGQLKGGIAIGPIGIAYSKDSLQWLRQNSPDSGFAIEMAVKPYKYHRGGSPYVLGFWDGASPAPLVVGQWLNHLIVRVRDMDAPKKYREFGARNILEGGKSELIQIVSDRLKTSVYSNGKMVCGPIDMSIIPASGIQGRFILGSSASGGSLWSGEYHGIALYRRKLSSDEAALRFRQWDSLGRTVLPPVTRAAHFFRFDESKGPIAHDCIAPGFDLQVPPFFHIIKKQILTGPWDDFQWNRSYFLDVVINLFGFMPIGFFMSLFLSEISGIHGRKKNLFITIAICFILSLCIELVQVYIPTRSSQLSDLFLNTIGGMLGGLLVIMTMRHFDPAQ
jgi:hypothetical protein